MTSFAECLQRGISGRLRRLHAITKYLQTSAKWLVDRSGVEPLTSAVQRREPLCHQVSASVTESHRERAKPGRSAAKSQRVVRRGVAFVC